MYNLKILNENNKKQLNFSLPQSGYVITGATGLTENAITMSTAQGNFQVGETLQGMAVSGTQSVISGVLMGEAREKRQHMLNVLAPQDTLTMIFNDSIQRTAYVRNGPTISQKPTNADFQVILYSPHPYWAAVIESIFVLGGISGKFKFPINYGTPHIFGVRADNQYENVYNAGNVPVSFIVRFIAITDVKNPKILNIKTNEYMRIGYEENPYAMVAGEQIIIDTGKEPFEIISIKNGVSKNIFGYYDFSSIEFQIQPGDNLLRYEADENRSGLDCRVSIRSEYSGAAGDDKTA